MKILIVHAHENPDSFCSSLAKTAKDHFEKEGHSITISDLYQMEFNPIGGKHDFKELSTADYYKYASEQLHASKDGQFADELDKEMEKLIGADILIFNFPLWWFGMPAILKGWVDRVLAYGVAYGGKYGFRENGRFVNKKAFVSLTTGSPASFYQLDGMHNRSLNDILRNIHEGIFALVGYTVFDPFVAYSVSRISNEERVELLKDYVNHLKKIV